MNGSSTIDFNNRQWSLSQITELDDLLRVFINEQENLTRAFNSLYILYQ